MYSCAFAFRSFGSGLLWKAYSFPYTPLCICMPVPGNCLSDHKSKSAQTQTPQSRTEKNRVQIGQAEENNNFIKPVVWINQILCILLSLLLGKTKTSHQFHLLQRKKISENFWLLCQQGRSHDPETVVWFSRRIILQVDLDYCSHAGQSGTVWESYWSCEAES